METIIKKMGKIEIGKKWRVRRNKIAEEKVAQKITNQNEISHERKKGMKIGYT